MNALLTTSRTVRVWLLCITLSVAFPCIAGPKDVLDPCLAKTTDDYHRAVDNVIDRAVGRPSSLQLTRFPSFEPESGIRLAGTTLYFVTLHPSYWGDSIHKTSDGGPNMDSKKAKVTTSVSHAAIDAGLARRIEQIYTKAIANAGQSDWTGLDGDTYIFSIAGQACGSTWSPRPGTRNARLVRLMERLQRHASLSSPIDVQRSGRALVKYLNSLGLD